MPLIHEIQAELLDENKGVGFILLKLKFLASKLDAEFLEDWVQHEAEGYPEEVDVPDYRVASITYEGNFADAVKQLTTTIPTHLVKEYAGEQWTRYEIRSGLSLIDQQLRDLRDGNHFGIDASNLPLLLQDKVFKGMAIIGIQSKIDKGAFLNVQHTVRSRVLDFVLKLEKQMPSVVDIEIGGRVTKLSDDERATVTHLTQQVIHGNVTHINASGDNLALHVKVEQGDLEALVTALTQKGIAKRDAQELAEIAKVNPGELDEEGTESWLQEKLRKGAIEAWGIGKDVAKPVIIEALKGYFGLS